MAVDRRSRQHAIGRDPTQVEAAKKAYDAIMELRDRP
jgi:hypothetical protein